jgi:hypothetical protein
LILAVLFGVFVWYYGVYLESFEQHRRLREVWSLDWLLRGPSLLLAYGSVGLLAAWRVWADREKLDYSVGFFLTCFAVSFLLAKHDWFVLPRQPLHFTRGYVWTPLCFLALPLLQRLLIALRARTNPSSFALVLLPFGAIVVSDNAVFVGNAWFMERAGRLGLYLTGPQKELIEWMEREQLNGVFLGSNEHLSYIMATFTPVRPYYGHMYNTPGYNRRLDQAYRWYTLGEEGEWMEKLDYIEYEVERFPGATNVVAQSCMAPAVAPAGIPLGAWAQLAAAPAVMESRGFVLHNTRGNLDSAQWELVHQNDQFLFFRRKVRAPDNRASQD